MSFSEFSLNKTWSFICRVEKNTAVPMQLFRKLKLRKRSKPTSLEVRGNGEVVKHSDAGATRPDF